MHKQWRELTDDVISAEVDPITNASHKSCFRKYGSCISVGVSPPAQRQHLLLADWLLKKLAQFSVPDAQFDGGLCCEVLPLLLLHLNLLPGMEGAGQTMHLPLNYSSDTNYVALRCFSC